MRCSVLLLALLGAAPARAQECDDAALTRAAVEAVVSGERDLTRLARAAGSDLPHVRGLELDDADDAAVSRFLASLRERDGAPIACGEASSEGRRLVLAGARAGGLAIDGAIARVRLADGWTDPHLYVRDARGQTRVAPVVGGVAELPSDLEPPLIAQVVATGPGGPRPVAERTVGPPPTRVVIPSDAPLPERLTRVRERAGVSPLRPNRLLTRVAVRHAQEVCRTGRVAHIGADGDPVERLAREGIRARHVGETVARSGDVDGAWAATLHSPSHRAALVDRRMTDVGVGVAEDRCVVVIVAAWPRAVPWTGR